eukprot:TRINITY_DN4981_c0_g2_i1.p1 TRINITY_DN4981_c0_g2~~TRINITY_DN4981_c0_g2_i1.p1  ORF type:complete len:470 (-),score=149.83 TRINITY_DN4981_c0_g2_i1:147-1556(-)
MRKAGLMHSDADNPEFDLFAALDKTVITSMSQLYDGIQLALVDKSAGVESFRFAWFVTKKEQRWGMRTCTECMATFSKQFPRLDSSDNSGCSFHPGKTVEDAYGGMVYACCDQEIGAPPCTRAHHGPLVTPFVMDEDPEKEQELEDSYMVQLKENEKQIDEYGEDDEFADESDGEPQTPYHGGKQQQDTFYTPSPYDQHRPKTTGMLFTDDGLGSSGWEQLHSTENGEFTFDQETPDQESQVLEIEQRSSSNHSSSGGHQHRHRHHKKRHHKSKSKSSKSAIKKKMITLHVFVHNEQMRKNKRTGRRNNARVQLSVDVNDESLTMRSVVRSCLRKFVPHRFEEETENGGWFLFDPLSELVIEHPSDLRKGVDLVLMQGTIDRFKLSTFLIEKEVEAALRECVHCGETFSLANPKEETAQENNCYHHPQKANSLGKFECCGSYDDWGCKIEHYGKILKPVRFEEEEGEGE